MKSTGIIRRIDDLGRVVIPREVRRALRIKEGDPLELYTYEGGVYFKPYLGEFRQFLDRFRPIQLMLYKRGLSTALFADDGWAEGSQSLRYIDPAQVARYDLGTWGGFKLQIGFLAQDLQTSEVNVEIILATAAHILIEIAREIWGGE